MIESTFTFKSTDLMDIHVYKWVPEDTTPVKAVIQLVHGSVEHAFRYKDFANYLVKEGFVVYANDHRGHGKTAGSIENLSYFSDHDNGFDLAVQDLDLLNKIIHQDYPTLKVFMLGHSLGSFMLRQYATEYKDCMSGMILTGTGGGKTALLNFGLFLAKMDVKNKGRKYRSKKLHNLMYGPLNNNVKNKKSDVDFISRDQKVIDAYNQDPYCGHLVTTEYALESLKGIQFCGTKLSFEKTPLDLPVYILSGEQDLVGGKQAKEVKRVYQRYVDAGVKDIQVKIYKDARHEILNEINKKEVYSDIASWVHEKLK